MHFIILMPTDIELAKFWSNSGSIRPPICPDILQQHLGFFIPEQAVNLNFDLSYAHNFEKVEGPSCLGILSICPFVCPIKRSSVSVLKFYKCYN